MQRPGGMNLRGTEWFPGNSGAGHSILCKSTRWRECVYEIKAADVCQTSTAGSPVPKETVKISYIWKGSSVYMLRGDGKELPRSSLWPQQNSRRGNRGPQGLCLALHPKMALWGRTGIGIQISCPSVWMSLQFFSPYSKREPHLQLPRDEGP